MARTAGAEVQQGRAEAGSDSEIPKCKPTWASAESLNSNAGSQGGNSESRSDRGAASHFPPPFPRQRAGLACFNAPLET
jgi:hypothetical protein